MKAVWAVVGVVAALVLVVGVSFVSNYNYGNAAEKEIVAQYDNMRNILAQYSLKVAEAAQVPAMQREDIKKITREAMQGRYGENGSKAVFQWIQEQNPQINSEVYTKIQQLIEAGRNKFENSQTKFIDTKRTYETNLGYLWKGFWLRVTGYPKIDLDEYVIISSEHANEAFETKVDKGLKLTP